MKNGIRVSALIAGAFFVGSVCAEEITLNTYYPAPALSGGSGGSGALKTRKAAFGDNTYYTALDSAPDGTLLAQNKVGIGTTSPQQQLHVVGNVQFDGTAIYKGANPFIHNAGGGGNFFAGVNAGNLTLSGPNNTAVGSEALKASTIGGYNTAVGSEALNATTTGDGNAAVGSRALRRNVSGRFNTAVGESALDKNTSGNHNTAVGTNALINTAGSRNIAIGSQAGDNITTGSNNLVIGYNIDAPSATANNQLTIGNIIFATGVDGTGTTVSTGNVGIRTANPQATLHVATGGTNQNFWVRNDGSQLNIGSANDAASNWSPVRFDASSYYFMSGNVGIGTTAPGAKLDVAGTAAIGSPTYYNFGDFTVANSGDATIAIQTKKTDDIRFVQIKSIHSGGAGGDGSDMAFFTQTGGATYERMRINYAGNVGIGITSPAQKLHVETNVIGQGAVFAQNLATSGFSPGVWGVAFSPNGAGVYGYNDATTGFGYGVWGATRSADTGAAGVYGANIATSGTSIGRSGVMGDSTAPFGAGVRGHARQTNGSDFWASGPAPDWISTSSIRWKRNIQPIENALERVVSLRGVAFDWDEANGGRHDLGMIAEEVGRVFPEIVSYEANGKDTVGMDYSRMTAILLEAVKELKAENDALKSRLEALEKKK